MYFCYIDESGGFEPPNINPSATPLMVLAGLVVEQMRVGQLTLDYLREKRRYFPASGVPGHHLAHILAEIKGASVRTSLRSASRSDRRHAVGFLGQVVALLERHHVRLIGRVWIKEPTKGLEPAGSYTYAIQDIARHFEHHLSVRRVKGVMLCDSRMANQNAVVSHSIFTQKMRLRGDAYPHIAEAPVFGSSINHAGLQLADLVASALIFPMAARVYCASHYSTVHVDPHYDQAKTRFGKRCGDLQYRYDSAGRTTGGVVVSDKLGKRPSSLLFS
jgi:hypothetical protein